MIKFGRILNIVMRLVACALPIAGAAAVRDVSKILEFNGIFGYFIAFLIPALLMYRSRVMCVEKWGVAGEDTPYKWIGSHPLYCKIVLAITTPAFFFVVYEVMKDYISG